jgi:hypothetical protein
LYFKTLVLKHVKQKTVKLQENIASPEANIWRWTQQKPELPSSMKKLSFVWNQRWNGMSVLCNIINQREAEILSPLRIACTYDIEDQKKEVTSHFDALSVNFQCIYICHPLIPSMM